MQQGAKDKMQRAAKNKAPNPEERRQRLEELRRRRVLREAYHERYLSPIGGGLPGGGPDRTADQIAARPEAWEQV